MNSKIDWWNWVTCSIVQLVEEGGTSEAEVKKIRMKKVGLLKAMQPKWARTIGLWGGVLSAREISTFAGIPLKNVHSYAHTRGLKMQRKGEVNLFQAEIAYKAVELMELTDTPVAKAAKQLGILPPEYLYYGKTMQFFHKKLHAEEDCTLPEFVESNGVDYLQDLWIQWNSLLCYPDLKPNDEEQESILAKLRGDQPATA